MNVKEFKYLVAIAETQSLTKASLRLYVSQSTLSKFILKLESEAGTPLFNRVGKEFVPNTVGNKCVEYARKIISLNNRLEETIRSSADTKNRIRLAFHRSFANIFFSTVFPLFQDKYPDIYLETHEVHSAEALGMLEKGSLDFAFVAMGEDFHPKFICESLSKFYVALLAAKEHPFFQKGKKHPDYPYPFVDFEWTKNESWILRHPNQHPRDIAEQLFEKYSISPHIVFESADMDSLFSAVDRGMGISLCAASSIPLANYKNIRFLSFKEGKDTVAYANLIYRPDSSFSEAQNDLLQMIKELFHKLV